MDCQEIQERIDDLLDDRLSPGDRQQALAHLAACPGCRRLVAAAQGLVPGLGREAVEGLTGRILAATSGPACARAEALLPDRVDGTLESLEAELVAGHLAHCPACRALEATIASLTLELRELATLEPDPGFTAEVMRATAGGARPAARRRQFSDWMGRLLARPRAAWELSYAATCLLVILYVPPGSPLRQLPERAVETLQRVQGESPALATELPDLDLALERAGGLRSGAERLAASLAATARTTLDARLKPRYERAAGVAAAIGRDGRETALALAGGDLAAGWRQLKAMAGHLRQLWKDPGDSANRTTGQQAPSAKE